MTRPQSRDVESGRASRRGLAVFFAALIIGSVILEYKVAALGGPFATHFVSIYMWWVAGSSLVARLLWREPLGDVAFRWGGWAGTRAVLVGTALPLVVGFAAYGIGWRTGLEHFSGAGIPAFVLGVRIAGSPTVRFLKFLLLSLGIGILWNSKSAAGEEIGWRGYMLTRLIDSGLPVPIFASGLVWALWHFPLIFCGQYSSVPHSFLSVCVFLVDIVGMGYVFAWLRLTSGSIWPCVWAHAAW